MTQSDPPRNSLRFSDSVATDSGVVLTKELERDATVERVDVRVYRGAEFALEVEPFVDREKDPDRTQREPLLTYRGRQFVAGDGDRFQFPVSRDVKSGQTVGVQATNQSSNFAYDFNTTLILEHAGGTRRAIPLLGRLL
jgi:hypothetical protein